MRGIRPAVASFVMVAAAIVRTDEELVDRPKDGWKREPLAEVPSTIDTAERPLRVTDAPDGKDVLPA
ncbi:MAG: hypothetical protein JNL39_17765 [Opitutaceae bacterium]|nr:hypothetical protein [Opitutaceae bacterium]